MKALGYHLVHYDLNSEDYLHPGRDQIQQSKDIVKETLAKAPENGNFIVLQHDIIPQSTGTLTEFTLQLVKDKGWKGMLDWITTRSKFRHLCIIDETPQRMYKHTSSIKS
jgi:hypothetical protein